MKPKKMEKYTGNYDLILNGYPLVLRVELVDDQLKAITDNAVPPEDLIPYGNNLFLARQANLPMLFKVDDSGDITGIRIQTNNTSFVIAVKKK